MNGPLRIVIADDNYLVREGTRRLLEDSGQATVVAAVGSAAELLDAVRRSRPAAVLTDIRMPPAGGTGGGTEGAVRPAMEGIDAAHAIRAADPDIGVVILSQYADESYAFELFRNGTAGLAYLLKDRVGDLHQLLAALRAVTSGGSVVDPEVVDALVSRRARRHRFPLRSLAADAGYNGVPGSSPGRDIRPALEVRPIPGMLEAWVEPGESGPMVMLAGEADTVGAGQLDALITSQLAGGTWRLTIDVSGLRFADSASIRVLALAARTLTERGGSLVLLDPRPSVVRVLALLGVDQMLTIRGNDAERRPGPGWTRRARDEHGTA